MLYTYIYTNDIYLYSNIYVYIYTSYIVIFTYTYTHHIHTSDVHKLNADATAIRTLQNIDDFRKLLRTPARHDTCKKNRKKLIENEKKLKRSPQKFFKTLLFGRVSEDARSP